MTHTNLPAPQPLAAGALRIFALGGLGEIGRNMTVFDFGGRLLIVDCGVLFPEESQPGIDLILPDFGPILDRLDDVEDPLRQRLGDILRLFHFAPFG